MKITKIAAYFLALIGLCLSLYATNHQLALKYIGSTDYACNLTNYISCDTVALSPYSEFLGWPISIYGVGYFAAVLVSVLLAPFASIYFMLATVGVSVCCVLAYISFFLVHSVCPTCLGVYLVCALQLGCAFLLKGKPQSGQTLPKTAVKSIFVLGLAVCAAQLIYIPVTKIVKKNALTEMEDMLFRRKALDRVLIMSDTSASILANARNISDPKWGNSRAKVELTEFIDFACLACGEFYDVVTSLQEDFPHDLKITIKNYPAQNACNPYAPNRHLHACELASLGVCAQERDKFWPFFHYVFSNQWTIDDENFVKKAAEQLKISEKDFLSCSLEKRTKDKILSDVELGRKLGVEGTPTIYINGWLYKGPKTKEALKLLIGFFLNPDDLTLPRQP